MICWIMQNNVKETEVHCQSEQPLMPFSSLTRDEVSHVCQFLLKELVFTFDKHDIHSPVVHASVVFSGCALI